MTSAILLLSVAFPPSLGYKGASTTIRDLARHGLYSGHLGTTPTKREAVRLIVLANMERAEALGQGAKARRRHVRNVMRAALADAFSVRTRLTYFPPSLADIAHDEQTEGYARRRFRLNPHDN